MGAPVAAPAAAGLVQLRWGLLVLVVLLDVWDLLQGDPVGCSCSSGRWSHRLGARWGSRLGYVQVPGSCSTAWLVGVSYVSGW